MIGMMANKHDVRPCSKNDFEFIAWAEDNGMVQVELDNEEPEEDEEEQEE